MRMRCTSKRTIQLGTLRLAEESLPCCIEGFEAQPFDVFRCDLEDVEHEFHAAFLDELADPEKDAYFCWAATPGDETQYVFSSKICGKRGNDEMCTLFDKHSGRCNWDLIDPVMVSIQAQVDQAMTHWQRSGFAPPLPKRGSD